MFRCDRCGVTSLPKVKAVKVVTSTRDKEYEVIRLDPETEEELHETVKGFEVVSELTLCPGCAGVEVKPEVKPDYTMFRLYAQGFAIKHVKSCKKAHIEDCKICQDVIKGFSTFPLPALSFAIQDKIPAKMRISLAEVVVGNMMDRTLQSNQRAKQDFEAAYPVLKAYEERGGRL